MNIQGVDRIWKSYIWIVIDWDFILFYFILKICEAQKDLIDVEKT
jgi:hypothetical protein